MPADREGHWNGVGGVGNVGRWEDKWIVGDERISVGELGGLGRGEVVQREDG